MEETYSLATVPRKSWRFIRLFRTLIDSIAASSRYCYARGNKMVGSLSLANSIVFCEIAAPITTGA